MISESMGKILGMVMAYGVSSLGLLLAYVNYRKRIVKAERVMSGTAWAVIAGIFLVIALGVIVVANLTARPAAPQPEQETVAEAVVPEAVSLDETPDPALLLPEPPPPRVRSSWSWVGLLLPASIFLFATWVTAALHRHFSRAVRQGP